MFIVKSLFLGIGLAMDAVAVSMASGLQNPNMKEERKLNIVSAFHTDSLLSWLKNAHLRDSKEKKQGGGGSIGKLAVSSCRNFCGRAVLRLHLFSVQYSQGAYLVDNHRYCDFYLILCGHSCGKEIRYDLCGKSGYFGRSRSYYCGYSSIKI